MWRERRIGVLAGGLSEEAKVSLASGQGVLEALRGAGLDAVLVELDDHAPWRTIEQAQIDVAFLVTHGVYGEDGCLQGMLEWMGIPYVGSGVLASALAMNKDIANRILRLAGLPVPRGLSVRPGDSQAVPKIEAMFGQDAICIKPNEGGSSVGVELLEAGDDRAAALSRIRMVAQEVLVEERVKGCEMTVAVLEGKALGSTEIEPLSGFYDFKNKYTEGASRYHTPARASDAVLKRLHTLSEEAVEALACRGGCRVDFMVDGDVITLLEVNTLPGMTSTSLLPKCAALSGLNYTDLCLKMLDGARLDRRPRHAPALSQIPQ
jgi:D-alanine-D-alanine ligase